jgi:hypothetical protein
MTQGLLDYPLTPAHGRNGPPEMGSPAVTADTATALGGNPVRYTDLDGRIPHGSNLLRGIKAHKDTILNLMSNSETIGTAQLFLPNLSAAKGNKGPFFVDYTREIGNITEFYEIKPISYMSSVMYNIKGFAIRFSSIHKYLYAIKMDDSLSSDDPWKYENEEDLKRLLSESIKKIDAQRLLQTEESN